uniref:Uncharacterized protein n=1 Tax=Arundo donax TaxID=35708 RepID=A0A0A9BXE2_ARUDO
MVCCCDKAPEVEDLLNQPLHGNDLTSAVSVDSNSKILLKDTIVGLVLFNAGDQGDAGNAQQLQVPHALYVATRQEAVHQSNPHEHCHWLQLHHMRMLDDPVHHDDALLHDETTVAAGHGTVHLSVVERNQPAPLPPPEPHVALLVVQVLKLLPR